MRPAHLVFVSATTDSSKCLCEKEKTKKLKKLNCAVNFLLLTHGGLESPADNKHTEFMTDKGINHKKKASS